MIIVGASCGCPISEFINKNHKGLKRDLEPGSVATDQANPSINRHGAWYVLKPDNNFHTAQFGGVGDLPITSAIVP